MLLKFYDSCIQREEVARITEINFPNNIKAGECFFKYDLNGEVKNYLFPVSGKLKRSFLNIEIVLKNGEIIGEIEEEIMNYDIKNYINDKIWDLAIAVNASFKGLLASMGESGQIAAKAIPIQTLLPVNEGKDELIKKIGETLKGVNLEDGDVIVLAEKLFPIAERRLIPLEMIMNENDPKRISIEKRILLKEKISQIIGSIVEDEDLILADTYTSDRNLGYKATIGASDHNKLAFECAASIKIHTGKIVDVIISDTDTGIDIRQTIIGCITLTSTPVGATRGVNLYECMRAACAAEFTRGSKKHIPIVLCKPADRCRKRKDIGEYRGYSRKLKFSQEGKIAYD